MSYFYSKQALLPRTGSCLLFVIPNYVIWRFRTLGLNYCAQNDSHYSQRSCGNAVLLTIPKGANEFGNVYNMTQRCPLLF